MKHHLLVLAATLLATACASTPQDGDKKTAGLQCTKETPTGSSLPVTRCRSAEDIQRDREIGREATEAMTQSRGRPVGSNGP